MEEWIHFTGYVKICTSKYQKPTTGSILLSFTLLRPPAFSRGVDRNDMVFLGSLLTLHAPSSFSFFFFSSTFPPLFLLFFLFFGGGAGVISTHPWLASNSKFSCPSLCIPDYRQMPPLLFLMQSQLALSFKFQASQCWESKHRGSREWGESVVTLRATDSRALTHTPARIAAVFTVPLHTLRGSRSGASMEAQPSSIPFPVGQSCWKELGRSTQVASLPETQSILPCELSFYQFALLGEIIMTEETGIQDPWKKESKLSFRENKPWSILVFRD